MVAADVRAAGKTGIRPSKSRANHAVQSRRNQPIGRMLNDVLHSKQGMTKHTREQVSRAIISSTFIHSPGVGMLGECTNALAILSQV